MRKDAGAHAARLPITHMAARMLVSLLNDFSVSSFDDDEASAINLSSFSALHKRFVAVAVHENHVQAYAGRGLPMYWFDDLAEASGPSQK